MMGIGSGAGYLLLVLGMLFWAKPFPAAAVDLSAPFKVAKLYDGSPLQDDKWVASLALTEKYEFYDIDGSSVAELRSMMKRKGARWRDGKVYAALTTWDLLPRYGIRIDNGKYSIQSVTTNLAIVYHLPRWGGDAAAPEQVGRLWNNYMDRLKEHEAGHRDLAVKAAAEINETLASLAGLNSRSDLEDEVARVVRLNLQRLRERQDGYDRETRHGETQGVVLP